MIFNEEFETLPRAALEAIQFRRLRALVERVYALVPTYRQKFAAAGVRPEDIQTLKDLPRLPFTTQAGPARQLSFWHVCRAFGTGSPHPCLVRHHRETEGSRIYAAGYSDLVRTRGPQPGRRRSSSP